MANMYSDVISAAEEVYGTDGVAALDVNSIDVNGTPDLDGSEIEAINRRFSTPDGRAKAMSVARGIKVRGFTAGKNAFDKLRVQGGSGNRPLTFAEQLILSELEKVNKQLVADLRAGKAYIRTARHFVKDQLFSSKNQNILQENATSTKYGLTSIANRTIPQNTAFAAIRIGVWIGWSINVDSGQLNINPALVNWSQNVRRGYGTATPFLDPSFIPEAIQNGGLIVKRSTTEILDIQLTPFFNHSDVANGSGRDAGEILYPLNTPELFNSGDVMVSTIRSADDGKIPTNVVIGGTTYYVNYFANVQYDGIEICRR